MCAKFGYDRSTPFLPTDGWKCHSNSSIPFLSFPFLPYFILAHLYSLNAWIDFYVWYLKMSGSAQGSAFCMIRPFKTNIWGVLTPKNYPKTPLYAEIPAKINILKNSCNFWTNQPIFIKFEIKVHFVEQNHRGYLLRLHNKIQDGGGRHLEFR